ncbi:MAG TPA: TonB C-terminal domain-containing protein [Gemmatimonadales bacterium]|nr:TonB C-terminal domain-containing protein [Gemmatimonadales bacterium]
MRPLAAARARRPGTGVGLVGTLAVHALAVAGLLLMVRPEIRKPSPPVYAVELIAAPAPAPKQRLAPEAIPTPPPEPPAPPVKAAPKPAEAAVPVPKRPVPTPPQQREAAPKTRSQATPLPGETPSTGTDVANLKTPGLQFPFPEYLRNVVNEILRRFNPQNAALHASIGFYITRDGSIRDLRFLQRSGSFSFDLEAQGAIEAAANANAFGPLPDGWPNDVLYIVYDFEPR